MCPPPLTAGTHQLHCVDRIEGSRRWVGRDWRALTAVDRGVVVVALRVPSRKCAVGPSVVPEIPRGPR
jgi:hypothetical protein